jgi:hypothetical protein
VSAREHVTDGGSCWCGPPVEFFGGGYIVIHNPEASAISSDEVEDQP